jgi:hypothetical protein
LVGILTLSFLVNAASKGRDRFAFRMAASSMHRETRQDGEHLIIEVAGDIQNKSTRVNCLSELYLVNWRRDRRGTILFEPSPNRIREGHDDIGLPLHLDGKQARKVFMSWDISLSERLAPTEIEIALEDSGDKLHDQRGHLRDRRNIVRRQELAKRGATIMDDGMLPFLSRYVAIRLYDLAFCARRMLWLVGF